MKRLIFEGSSDDTFGCYAKGIDADYDNCASGKPISLLVKSGADALVVVGQYCPGHADGWLIGVARHDPECTDETQVPAWPIYFERADREYTPRLVIEAPDDVTVEVIHG